MFRSEKVRVRRRGHLKSAQKFLERIAKIPEIWRATRTEFVNLGQHVLRKPFDITYAVGRVHNAFRSEKARARRRDHANFVRKSRERIAKFPEFRRATRTEFVLLGQHALRIPYDVTEALDRVHRAFRSKKAATGSIARSDPKKQARGVEITQILCESPGEELQNFRNFGMPLAEKNVCTRPACAAQLSRNVAAALSELGKLFRSEKAGKKDEHFKLKFTF